MIYSVRFAPDGKTLLTGCTDGTAKLWQVATQQELRTFKGHLARVNQAVFAPDGSKVATASDDATLRL